MRGPPLSLYIIYNPQLVSPPVGRGNKKITTLKRRNAMLKITAIGNLTNDVELKCHEDLHYGS